MDLAILCQRELIKVRLVLDGCLEAGVVLLLEVELVKGLVDSDVVLGLDELEEGLHEPDELSELEGGDGLSKV